MQFPWPRSRGVAWALVAAVLAVPALANAQPQPQQPAAENPAPATTPPDTAAENPAPATTPPDTAAENPAPAPTSPETEAENPAPAPTSPETEAENPAPEDQEQPSDDDLAELSAALGADAAEVAESQPAAPAAAGGGGVSSLNPDISLILDVALASFSDDAPLQAGDHDPKASGFSLQQAELALTRAVDPYFKVNANIVFTEEGVEVEEAYGSTLALPWNLKARVGKFLTQAGRINPTHPHTWAFVDQPFILSRLFGGEGNSGVGAELSYLTPLPWYVEIIGSMTDAAGAESARSFYGATDLGVSSPLDLQATLAIKQFFDVSPNWSVLWGLSALTGPNSTGPDNRTDIAATDLYIKYRPITHQSYTIVSLQAEWFFRRRGLGADRLIDQGGYAQLFYRFAKEWGAAARYELGTPAKDSAGDVGADYLDPEWTAARHRVTAALTFWPTEFSRIRAQGSVDLPQWRDDPIWAGFLAFEFSIGAHGAHSF